MQLSETSAIHKAFDGCVMCLRIHLGISLGYRKKGCFYGINGGLRLDLYIRDVYLQDQIDVIIDVVGR